MMKPRCAACGWDEPTRILTFAGTPVARVCVDEGVCRENQTRDAWVDAEEQRWLEMQADEVQAQLCYEANNPLWGN